LEAIFWQKDIPLPVEWSLCWCWFWLLTYTGYIVLWTWYPLKGVASNFPSWKVHFGSQLSIIVTFTETYFYRSETYDMISSFHEYILLPWNCLKWFISTPLDMELFTFEDFGTCELVLDKFKMQLYTQLGITWRALFFPLVL